MIYIGRTEKNTWLRMKELSHTQGYLPEQPPDCPYILLKQAENQYIGLAAYPKQEGLDLYIIPVYEPGLKSKDIRACKGSDLEIAQKYAERLLTASISNPHRCSTDKQG